MFHSLLRPSVRDGGQTLSVFLIISVNEETEKYNASISAASVNILISKKRFYIRKAPAGF